MRFLRIILPAIALVAACSGPGAPEAWEAPEAAPMEQVLANRDLLARLHRNFDRMETEHYQPGCSGAHLFSYGGKPWLTQYWVRRVKEQAYGGVTPDKGYGGHDEDQGQMGGVSALMAMGLFSVQGTESDTPYYDITSPIFDQIRISLNNDYYPGKEFIIKVNGNSSANCYIQKAELNGENWEYSQFAHKTFAEGGELELWLGDSPQKSWGKQLY